MIILRGATSLLFKPYPSQHQFTTSQSPFKNYVESNQLFTKSPIFSKSYPNRRRIKRQVCMARTDASQFQNILQQNICYAHRRANVIYSGNLTENLHIARWAHKHSLQVFVKQFQNTTIQYQPHSCITKRKWGPHIQKHLLHHFLDLRTENVQWGERIEIHSVGPHRLHMLMAYVTNIEYECNTQFTQCGALVNPPIARGLN